MRPVAFANSVHSIPCGPLRLDFLKVARTIVWHPRLISDFRNFRCCRNVGAPLPYPCLQKWGQQAGSTGREYFCQDFVAPLMICQARPTRHCEIHFRITHLLTHEFATP